MTTTQKRILWTAAVFSFVFNACCLGYCLYCEHEMEKDGIIIEAILGKE